MAILDFSLIGCGNVTAKYWLPAHRGKKLNIDSIFSIEPQPSIILETDHIRYYQIATQIEAAVDTICSGVSKLQSTRVALLTPTSVRLRYLQLLMAALPPHTQYYIEKPYTDKQAGINLLTNLLSDHNDSLYLANQYCAARANILYPQLPKKLPHGITFQLYEGEEYYRPLLANHSYWLDGPELDLGFHALSVINRCLEPFAPQKLKIVTFQDLNYGEYIKSGFSLRGWVITTNGEVPIAITAGKGLGVTQKYIELQYENMRIRQDYTYTPNGSDQVVKITGSNQILMAKHQVGYNYYCNELINNNFSHQTYKQKLSLLRCNHIMSECKKLKSINSLRMIELPFD